ncbi:MAG TPA: hypothetical protein VN278_07235 [Methanosarcina sp.]|nr:hypothetical protein [Methanosarcina sp.]
MGTARDYGKAGKTNKMLFWFVLPYIMVTYIRRSFMGRIVKE